jgi:hypothetical protein
MDLLDVEGVRLQGPVFYRPIFNGSDFGGDHWLFVGFKDLRLLPLDRDIKLNRTVGTTKFFREIELPLRRNPLMRQIFKPGTCGCMYRR